MADPYEMKTVKVFDTEWEGPTRVTGFRFVLGDAAAAIRKLAVQ